MTDYRQQWKDRGKLYPCANRVHEFKIGRLIGEWQWAQDCWSEVSANGSMHNYALGIYSVNWLSGLRAWKVIIWKLSIIFGFLAKEKTE